MTQRDLHAIEVERERIRPTYLTPEASRTPSSARGLHHVALVCADVERTVRFYQELDQARRRPHRVLSERGTSIYFRDPDGARLELIADPPGEMYGTKVV
jgi:catechol-2,3-dioxygenase